MTDLIHGKQCGLPCMVDECGISKVTVVDRRPPAKGPITARHVVAQAPILRGSWRLR